MCCSRRRRWCMLPNAFRTNRSAGRRWQPNTGGTAGQGGSDNVGQGGSAGSQNTGGTGGTPNTGGTGGGGGGNTDPGQQQCQDMLGCFNACPDDASGQACVQNCFETATPEAQNRYQAIIGCAQAAGCTGLDGSIDQTCLNEECSAELEACFGPTANQWVRSAVTITLDASITARRMTTARADSTAPRLQALKVTTPLTL